MKRCVIVGGADIADYAEIRRRLSETDYVICCDSGLRHTAGLGVRPDLIVGDFDSHEDPHARTETIVLPHVKDDTDTVYAAKEAVRRGFDEFLLVGAAGGRLDHTLGNVSILLKLYGFGKHAVLVDDYSEMEIVGKEPAAVDASFPYFSLLNISGTAKKVTVENALYPLSDAEIPCDYQYGISNEVLPGKTARVRVGEGCALLMRVRRDRL